METVLHTVCQIRSPYNVIACKQIRRDNVQQTRRGKGEVEWYILLTSPWWHVKVLQHLIQTMKKNLGKGEGLGLIQHGKNYMYLPGIHMRERLLTLPG